MLLFVEQVVMKKKCELSNSCVIQALVLALSKMRHNAKGKTDRKNFERDSNSGCLTHRC